MKAEAYQELAAEGDVKKTVEDYLTRAGIIHVRFNNMSAFSKKTADGWKHSFRKVPEHQLGAPDFFVFVPLTVAFWDDGPQKELVTNILRSVAVETKRPKVKKLREAQERWRRRWEDAGGFYLEVRTLEDLVDGLKRILE